ncbi:CDF family Co(II)/Ni(II) efflux transporter DmeF [Candidatus Deferrimicrobium sp.]|uniref:CDF family Co(II)/Ni(II) efflux transporter DmeF n=1 Tax=Candidatus Deferrimicrobium sp. TaxID=3060586 RepID=UPI003C3DA1FC
MHTESVERWVHDHTFGQDEKKSAERRTLIVSVVTILTMIVEIGAGIVFGSMALLADGLHMGSHASALAISVFAYRYTRVYAKDARFNFGTGKVSSLAAFASATLLALVALVMAWESVGRLLSPVVIRFNQAILVAVIGLIINGVCLAVLGGHVSFNGMRGRENEEDADHVHVHADRHDHHDHNFRSAYLHVLADALTSVLAIFALLFGKYLRQQWLDPCMGLVGATLVVRWSWGLLRSSARVLLDLQAPDEVLEPIRKSIESEGDNRVSDLHVWSVGPGIYAAEIAIVSSRPRDPDDYYKILPGDLGLVHVTVETHRCAADAGKDSET